MVTTLVDFKQLKADVAIEQVVTHYGVHLRVIGLMGSTISRHQADLLSGHFDRVLLMLDGDAAGREGARTIANALKSRLHLTVILLEDGTQPDQQPPGEIRRLVQDYVEEFAISKQLPEGDDGRDFR